MIENNADKNSTQIHRSQAMHLNRPNIQLPSTQQVNNFE